MIPPRSTNRLLLACALVAFAGCGGDEPKRPAVDPDLLLTIDGIDIKLQELAPYLEFVAQSHPDTGRKTAIQMVLEKYLVPLRLAQRAFPAERAQQHQRAADMRSVVGNVLELQQKSELQVVGRGRMTRMMLDLPVAMFLFDPLRTGDVGGPLEVPRGYIVAGALDYHQAPLAAEDMVDALEVGFFTHEVGAWKEWIEAEQLRVKNKITYIHPDYKEVLPTWCN